MTLLNLRVVTLKRSPRVLCSQIGEQVIFDEYIFLADARGAELAASNLFAKREEAPARPDPVH
ncbi:hypothetical protein [Panacagrimonas sp.]|uniref:hypothetical protein n=1 Tax=Panacagrimonas sp. TaxID=2480088 RepID=UPI003B517A90